MNKKLAAEALGTFDLVLMITLASAGSFVIPVPILAALTLGVSVYTLGSISGCHLNPAVTLGLISIKKITPKLGGQYILAQALGAVLAWLVATALGVSMVASTSGSIQAGLAEALGMFFFCFGIASVVAGKVEKSLSGIVIGASLLGGIAFSALAGSTGVLNPAVALSLMMYSPAYLIGPVIGAVAGFKSYEILVSNR